MFSRSQDIETKSWSPNCIKMSYDKNDEYLDEDDDELEENEEETDDDDEEEEEASPGVDELEVDYDDSPTTLYLFLEDRKWEKAIQRLRENKRGPKEARTWVFRRDDSNVDMDSTSKGVRWRILPIHASCIFRSPMSLIEALIEVYPKGLERPDDQDMLPLHLACRNGASKTVVSKIIEAYPKGVYSKDRKGRSPLDLAFASASQHRNDIVDVLRAWMQKLDPNTNTTPPNKVEGSSRDSEKNSHTNTPSRSAKVETAPPPVTHRPMTPSSAEKTAPNDDRTLLFQLILKKDWSGVIQRCQTHPEEASAYITTKGLHGQLHFLPLHKVCVLQPPLLVVKAIIAAFPDGPMSQDQDGWLPLHCACYYGAVDDIVATLLSAFPKGAQAKDNEGGRNPLHYACIKHASVSTLQLLIRAYPKSLISKDDDGRLPIHYACSKGASSDTIETLIASAPKSTGKRDDQGRFPLHLACRKNLNSMTVRAVLASYPEAARLMDDENKLPVHYACKHVFDCASKFAGGIPVHDDATIQEAYLVIQQLLEAYPASATVEDGNRITPLMEVRDSVDSLSSDESVIVRERLSAIISLLEKYSSEKDPKNNSTVNARVTESSNSEKCEETVNEKADVTALEKRVLELESLVRDVVVVCNELRKKLNDNNLLYGAAENAESSSAICTENESRKILIEDMLDGAAENAERLPAVDAEHTLEENTI